MLLKTTTGIPASNIDSDDTPHDTAWDRHSAMFWTQVTIINTQLHHHKMLTDQIHQYTCSHTLLQILKKKTKQIIMDMDALSNYNYIYIYIYIYLYLYNYIYNYIYIIIYIYIYIYIYI